MTTYHQAQIVHTEPMLGGIRYRVYVTDRDTGRTRAVGVLTLTKRDLEFALNEIERIRREVPPEAPLPF